MALEGQRYKCVWCDKIRDTSERKQNEDVVAYLVRYLGPKGCCAPDGDGHLWKEIKEGE